MSFWQPDTSLHSRVLSKVHYVYFECVYLSVGNKKCQCLISIFARHTIPPHWNSYWLCCTSLFGNTTIFITMHKQRCALQVPITTLAQSSGCIVRIRNIFLNLGKCFALCFPLSLWRQEFLLFTCWRPHCIFACRTHWTLDCHWIFACRTHWTLDSHPDFKIGSTQLQD